MALFKKIDHLALHVSNIEKSVLFYADHFGFEKYFETTLPSGLQIVYLKLGDTVLELNNEWQANIAGFHFCLQTTDFATAIEKLQRAGLTLVQAPHAIRPRVLSEEGWQRAVFLGPDQEQIEIRG